MQVFVYDNRNLVDAKKQFDTIKGLCDNFISRIIFCFARLCGALFQRKEILTMAVTFHHVHLRCEDLEGAVRYYEEMFDGKVDETVEVRGLKNRPHGNRWRTDFPLT